MATKVAFSFVLLVLALSATVFGQEPEYPIIPHPETQKLLDLWAAPMDIEKHYALLGQIVPLASDDYQRFVQQVVYFHHRREEMGKGVLLGALFDFVPERDLATALAPYLYGQHAKVRKLAQQLFMRSLGEAPHYGYGPGDLSYVVDALRSNDEKISAPLQRAVFEVAPYAAFRLYLKSAPGTEGPKLLRAFHSLDSALFDRDLRKRELIQAAKKGQAPPADFAAPWKPGEESIAAVRTLGTSKHWWARMFASEFMYHNKDFRIAELIAKLEQDENDLVRQSAASIKNPDPLRAPVGPLRP